MPSSNPSLPTRLFILMAGLALYGLGLGMVVKAEIGAPPWDVFALGLANQLGVSYGIGSVIVSALVLLAWIPLKVRPGIGSILNAICIGLFSDLFMPYLPDFTDFLPNLAMFIFGMIMVAFATGFYISSHLGQGPRDGLMLGTQKLLGWKFWKIRSMFEATVLLIGWLLGGQAGIGTVIFAVAIGYLTQISLQIFKLQNKGLR